MAVITTYGDISPRTAAHASAQFLTRAQPILCLEQFGQSRPIPQNKGTSVKFRRYNALDNTPVPLVEGVTPLGKKLSITDVIANLTQYGDFVTLTDVVLDTHEDPVLQETITILGEQAGQMVELDRHAILRAGTNVVYANGAARNAVNTVHTLTLQRNVVRYLLRQNAKPITTVLRPGVGYGSSPIPASFFAIVHPDMENDIRGIAGFVPSEKYASQTPYQNELGAVEKVRYLTTTLAKPFLNAGGAKGSMISSGGTNADVYPILFMGADAFGNVPLRGKNATTIMVVNPKPTESDPLGQRGSAGWKCMTTTVILNDLWMMRGEAAVTA